MQAQQLSRSQRRKQRLIARGMNISNQANSTKTFPPTPASKAMTISVANSSQNQISNSRRRRNRNRRRRQRNNRSNSGGSSGIIPYDLSLRDPENTEGAKIPDIIAYPTGTFQLTQGFDFGPGAGDACAVQFYPVVGNGSTVYPMANLNGAVAGSLATRNAFSWTARASIAALYSLYRPVSASVEIFYIGTAQLEGGEVVAGCTWYSSLGSPPTTFAAMAALNNMEFFPVDNGVRVLWKPMDNSHLTFQDTTGPAGTAGNPIYPQIFIAIEGLSSSLASTNCFHCNVCCNFEAIPNSNTANLIETSPSPYDPSALRRAFEWAQQGGSSAIGTLENAIEVGRKVVNVGGMVYEALPQRVKRRIFSGAANAIASMMTHQKQLMSGETVSDPFAVRVNGKEEEEEDSYESASKKFEELNLNLTPISPGLRLRSDFGSPKVTKKA